LRSPTVSTKLLRIVKQSENNPDMVFTTLAHHIDVDFLREAYLRLKKNAASGVDKVSHKDYASDLEKNLVDLHDRLNANRYRAMPTKRVWIDKDDGSKRGLGIPVLEDKIVQKAVALILESVYEPIFKDFSYGFRPKRSAHDALRSSRDSCFEERVNWIVDADIKGFFDNISHEFLLNILREKVKDGALLRLIGKWLKAGVLDGCNFTNTDKGTPQGGVMTPPTQKVTSTLP
jgi:RNA-directed DNA polymerase